MTPMFLRARHAVAFAGVALALVGIARASEQDDGTLNKVVELNKKALALYEALDMEGAAATLAQALGLCTSAKLEKHPTAARTHIHLGVVYVSGLKNRDLGLAEFREALAIDPQIKISKSLVNPEVQEAFAEAMAVSALPMIGARPLPFPTGQETPARTTPIEGVDYEINHPVVTEAMRNKAIAIKVQVPPGLGATTVMLAYRAEDGNEFLARDMVPVESAASWFQADIPVEATQGKTVAYYIEAQNADDQTLVHNGTPEHPHRIALASEIAPEESATSTVPPAGKNTGPGPAGLWFVLAAGGGGGYHKGSPELNPQDSSTPPKEIQVSGFGLAQLMHLAPEIGYFHSDHLVLSAQGRFQFVTGAQDVHLGQKTYQPAKMAFAGLVKATWLQGSPSKKFRTFLSVQAGGGQIRQTVQTPASANLTGCGAGPSCKDTVVGGMGLVGIGTGFTHRLSETFHAYAAINMLAGGPNFLVQADLNLGLAIIR